MTTMLRFEFAPTITGYALSMHIMHNHCQIDWQQLAHLLCTGHTPPLQYAHLLYKIVVSSASPDEKAS